MHDAYSQFAVSRTAGWLVLEAVCCFGLALLGLVWLCRTLATMVEQYDARQEAAEARKLAQVYQARQPGVLPLVTPERESADHARDRRPRVAVAAEEGTLGEWAQFPGRAKR